MEIVPVTRKEKFIKAAIDGVPLSIDAIPRIEMYLAKISGDNVDLPDPITRIEKYLAVIAGMDVVLPSPVTRVEKYLAKIAGMDVETPNPVTRIEMLLDEWAESSGGVLKTVSGAVVSVSDALNALELFPKWQCTPPMSYTYGKRVVGVDGKLYKCIQPHISQSDWPPETTTALWVLTSVEEWPEWIQPTGAHDAYPLNAKCSHNGKHWINTGKDGNEYEPGVWGWTEA